MMLMPYQARQLKYGALAYIKRFVLCAIFLMACQLRAHAVGEKPYVSSNNGSGYFALSSNGKNAPLYISASDYSGVIRALKDLQTDIGTVTGTQPLLFTDSKPATKQVVLVGTIGKSKLIDGLIRNHKLNVAGIAGKWETFILQTVQNPMPGVSSALVIAGSDKRGTIYGIYDLSAQIGVSPWFWWADVPVKKQTELYVLPGRHTQGTPAVKYRGIFINDEAPAFSGWTKEKFGGVNHLAYEKVFELILRLKGNYLWPAMWGNAFNDDDKLDPQLADDYGIVMGTSHHEPMDRAQQEWKRYGTGAWDYEKNADVLKAFWKKGIENMGTKETLVTIGMRGDGDMAMTEGSNVALLEKIVKDQRQIIADVTGKPASKTPQMWALYKEVQDYYDKGMRVPDDVTLLLCDDNWGNIRKLPKLGEPKRTGGYGIYYHFDYVGDPRNYKWLNTNPISKTWEQMHLAHEYGANQVWIVNVGDLKPMEFPISFFLDYAWNPDKIPANGLDKYTEQWAAQQFGPQYANEIAGILSKYTRYNGRRKPEQLDQDTYSLTNYREFETIASNYNALEKQAEELGKKLPAEYQDAYFELVLHPVKACANLNQLYYTVAKNRLYAKQNRAATNDLAEEAKALFAKDAEISAYYNHVVANGKWDHMMDQTHIGYTYWQQPPVDKMPEVKQIEIADKAAIGVSIAGSDAVWPMDQRPSVIPEITRYSKNEQYIEVFNQGKQPFTFTAKTTDAWIKLNPASGTIDKQQRVSVSVDWAKTPQGWHSSQIVVSGAGGTDVSFEVPVDNSIVSPAFKGFIEADGYVSMEAAHYTQAINTPLVNWQNIPGYGRTLSGMMPVPVRAKAQIPGGNSPHLQYRVSVTDTGKFDIQVYISPTIDFTNRHQLRYAISVDDEQPQIINLAADESQKAWAKSVSDNIKVMVSKHHITRPGVHTINYWMVDPAVVVQKLVLNCGGVQPSYLGPPESYRQ